MASHENGFEKETFSKAASSSDDTGLKIHTSTPDASSTENEDFEKQPMGRVSTNESSNEPRFEPIRAGDPHELTRLASQIAQSPSYPTSIREKHSVPSLRRQDTLDGVNYGDDILDPNSKDFDVYKW